MIDDKSTDAEKSSVQETGPKTPPLDKKPAPPKAAAKKAPESNAVGSPGTIVKSHVDHSDIAAIVAEVAAAKCICTIVARDEETRSIAYEEIAKAEFDFEPGVRLNKNLGVRLTWRKS